MCTSRRIPSIAIILFVLALIGCATADEIPPFAQIREGVRSRHVSSYDRSGGNDDFVRDVADGKTVTLLNIAGAGVIHRIWITVAPPPERLSRNDLILRMYWDGNPKPSVEAPLGPFFGQGWSESYSYLTEPLAAGPAGGGRSLVCYFAMPFSHGARIEVENQSGQKIDAFYYNIDYTEMAELPANAGRFHAWYHREVTPAAAEGENEWSLLGPQGKNTQGSSNYLVADIKGHGQFVGVNYYVQSPTPMWFGEGDEMIFIDGETDPSIRGTGTEDYFNLAWCPKDVYMHPYFGLARTSQGTGWLGRHHYYRFHLADPIYFDKSLRFTIEHGHNNCLTLDLATVAYWYQSEAVGVPPIPDRNGRRPLPEVNFQDIHRWRDAWRKQLGGDPQLWGKEQAKPNRP